MRASSKGEKHVGRGGTRIPPTDPFHPFVVGPQGPRRPRISTSTADADFKESADRVRVRTGETDSRASGPPSGSRSGPAGRAFREAAFFSFLHSSSTVRRGLLRACDESFGRRERRSTSPAPFFPTTPGSYRTPSTGATLAVLLVVFFVAFFRPPGVSRLGLCFGHRAGNADLSLTRRPRPYRRA